MKRRSTPQSQAQRSSQNPNLGLCEANLMRVFRRMFEELNTLVKLSSELIEQKKFNEAQVLYEKWLSVYEPDLQKKECANGLKILSEARNNLGQIKYLQVEFKEALKDYDEAVRHNPTFAAPYYNKGTIMYRMGNFSEAIKDIQKAVDLDSSNQEFQIGLQKAKEESNQNSQPS